MSTATSSGSSDAPHHAPLQTWEWWALRQWWASRPAHRPQTALPPAHPATATLSSIPCQTALSQLRCLIITECSNPDVPALLGTLAASCTQLTHLELRKRPWSRSSEEHLHGALRALDQLSSEGAFPALQTLAIGGGPLAASACPLGSNMCPEVGDLYLSR
jgi:hypothetical protein